MKLQPPTPILRSFNETETRKFFLDFLGFHVLFEHRFHEGAPLYMGVQRDQCVLHLSEHHGDSTPGAGIRIDLPDVHAFCAELVGRNYKNARPTVLRQDWGYDEIILTDPSGNRLVFGTPH